MAITATSETGNKPRTAPAVSLAQPSLLADYATLFKLRVSTMVIITSAAGFYLGSLRSGISPFNFGMIKALGGIAVVTSQKFRFSGRQARRGLSMNPFSVRAIAGTAIVVLAGLFPSGAVFATETGRHDQTATAQTDTGKPRLQLYPAMATAAALVLP